MMVVRLGSSNGEGYYGDGGDDSDVGGSDGGDRSEEVMVTDLRMVIGTVTISFSCQLDTNLKSPGEREPQLKTCSHQFGLWPCRD